MDNKMYSDIYNDFFGKKIKTIDKNNGENKDVGLIYKKIDSLYLIDNSKILLKKLVDYLKKYDNKNFLKFNIALRSNSEKLLDEIISIINSVNEMYRYTKGREIAELSLYKMKDLEEFYEFISDEYGIIIVNGLDSLDYYDEKFKKQFIYFLVELIQTEKIVILSGEDDVITSFLHNNDILSTSFKDFCLYPNKVDANDIYQSVIERIKDVGLGDEFNLKVLDYIVEDYNKTNLDYDIYIDNLCKYISFNKDVPKLEVVKSLDEIFKDLNELVGLDNVKRTLHELVDLITLKNKTSDDLKINNINLHMVFLGNPGTGKTTVARLLCSILYELKYIKQNKLIEVSSKDLVAEYVGQTAPKTMSLINKAMGGILFIDEAYTLASNDNNSYNQEAVATLIKAMEDYRDNLVVIFAGYTKEMQAFLNSNSGIVSRIGYTLEFSDYSEDELRKIFVSMVNKSGFIITNDALEEFDSLVKKHQNDKNFGNARFVRNVFEKTILKHASNIKNSNDKNILKTITKNDIYYNE